MICLVFVIFKKFHKDAPSHKSQAYMTYNFLIYTFVRVDLIPSREYFQETYFMNLLNFELRPKIDKEKKAISLK